MQKLLRRTPVAYGPPTLSVNASLLSHTTFLSLGFHGGTAPILTQIMSTHSAIVRYLQPVRQPRKPTSAAAAARSLTFPKADAYGFRSCGCSADGIGGAVPYRTWITSMEVKESSRLSFSTHAGSPGEGGDQLPTPDELSEGESAPMDVKARLPRRQRNLIGGSGAVVGSPDLLAIPGVGPRNLRKLVEKGFDGVAQLKKLYKDKFFGKSSQKMVEFLQSSVGIIHKNHAESITTFIKESVDEELKDDVKPVLKKRITLCVEGNISVGKTTFLQRIANETLELRDLVEIVPEPVGKWQDVGPDHFNVLNAFYAEPERYAYTFQNYVFVTRVMQEKESSEGIKPLRLMERSVFSDRMVFVRAVHEAKWMNEMEISIYDSWFDPVVSSLPGLIPDGFIYLRASPDTCHKRMLLRKRSEEGGVSLDYLRDLHEKHESWLFPSQSVNHGLLSLSKLPTDIDWSLHPNIKDRVFYLDGDHMHSSIRKVPALVLDCEPDIDFSRDLEAKKEYARQVAEFFEFVKNTKEESTASGEDNTKEASQNRVLLPHHGKLWLPGSQPLPDTLDLRRTMSSFMSH